jgi:hypothetical protein
MIARPSAWASPTRRSAGALDETPLPLRRQSRSANEAAEGEMETSSR